MAQYAVTAPRMIRRLKRESQMREAARRRRRSSQMKEMRQEMRREIIRIIQVSARSEKTLSPTWKKQEVITPSFYFLSLACLRFRNPASLCTATVRFIWW